MINITRPPPSDYVGWEIRVNDATRSFDLIPIGNTRYQVSLFALLLIVPILLSAGSVYAFVASFYKVKHNRVGTYKELSSSKTSLAHRSIQGEPDDMSPTHVSRISRLSKTGLSFFGASRSPVMSRRSSIGARDGKRTILIATMEYDIEDWKIKVKIGGLGVIAQLMGKELGHIDLIWVIPCVGDVVYPMDTPADPMNVTILDTEYSIQVQYHQLGNITYVLLDAPIFRKQTRAEPYPARMDDLTSAIYYSAWNQCIAQTSQRFPVDLYHINDYHGCLAPLYLLPSSIAVCLSLHNAEFQGLWPMRTTLEREEVSRVFNLSPGIIKTFVQFGEIFNMLHAGASYLRVYQSGFGAVGVSAKYGQRAYLRYPIFWGLKKIGQLPNPDPSDTAEWNGTHASESDTTVDVDFEAERPSLRIAAQKWAGLDEDPEAELFVFVGRWSLQKGIDLIADVFPSVLERHSKVQLICVGPVIDMYGKFAALKLQKLMERYPRRVCSRPVFTALPPFIFSGAEFALIPSRDEPFGLVAVEFGRKGALGVGSRVGGLGNMPGWWYTIESMSTQHLLSQFRKAIMDALKSRHELRAMMRALSAKQRFPVAQWVETLDALQTAAIHAHTRVGQNRSSMSPSSHRNSSWTIKSRPKSTIDGVQAVALDSPAPTIEPPTIELVDHFGLSTSVDHQSVPKLLKGLGSSAPLDLSNVIGNKDDFHLQKVDPSFTDKSGHYHSEFAMRLDKSDNLSNSTTCIEEYIKKSEKTWHQMRHAAKLGDGTGVPGTNITVTPVSPSRLTPVPSQISIPLSVEAPPSPSRASSVSTSLANAHQAIGEQKSDGLEEFLLGDDYVAPRYLRRWMQIRIGGWPVYSFVLALGQIMAANSYQLTLLTGQVGQEAERLYVLCSIYIVASIFFWIMFRRLRSATTLTIPFIIYGFAFFFVGLSPSGQTISSRGWLQNIGTGLYTAASASGSLYFSSNFGDEGGSTTTVWILRAAVVQGVQQAYISTLWFWGAYLNQRTVTSLASGISSDSAFSNSPVLTAICIIVACFLWAIAAVVFYGLPQYYTQTPGQNQSFYRSILRRKTIVWFFIVVVIQNFFLSTQYGRSWIFLWNSQHLSYWQIACLVIFFYVLVWSSLLWLLSIFSRSHSWLLPIAAAGLGAPRWAQTWWGVSGMAAWLPWTNGFVASALVSRGLWLWLGTLDAIQSVGIGMIILSTMTRIHASFALIAAQCIGASVTAIARACAPNAVGPGPVFPNIVANLAGLANAWFWIGLVLNFIACLGFLVFFRKEQLSKP